jgi:hypothetical protein
VKGFKEGMKSETDGPASSAADTAPAQQIPGKTIDAEVKKETTRS